MHTLLLLVLRRSHKSLACVSVARRSIRCRQRIRIALTFFSFFSVGCARLCSEQKRQMRVTWI